MRFNSIVSAFLITGPAFQAAASPNPLTLLKPRRTTSIFNSPAAQQPLPDATSASAAATSAGLNLKDIQADILVGMKKKKEKFFFFRIDNVVLFKTQLKLAAPFITTTKDALDVSTQPDTMVNVAFSQSGLTRLNVTDDLGDAGFSAGQFADADALGDPGTTNWVTAFKGTNIHGVFLLASDSTTLVDTQWLTVKTLLGLSITELYTLTGSARPGSQEGHEHFGYMDGISQPGINGFTVNPVPGQTMIDPGMILLAETGDPISRPAWSKGGSFLAFRQLKQLVPEFNKFVADHPILKPGLTPQQGSDLFGARMVGRWKSGTPVDISPVFDNLTIASNPLLNNNFDYSHPGFDITSDETHCPFSAHIRKTAPRADFSPVNTLNHIIRAGIPYGPEVTTSEAASNNTGTERGLAFVAYQSNLFNGFQFLQKFWANNPSFIFGKSDPTPGFDPIIGQNAGGARFTSGLDPTNPNADTTFLTDFVQSRGGEYFFVPPISAIKNVLT